MAHKKNDSLDACPFPPDSEPPSKTSTTNMMEAMDWFFDGWRNTILVLSLLSMLTVYSLFSVSLALIPVQTTPDSWNSEGSERFPYTYAYIKSDFDLSVDTELEDDLILQGNDVLEYVNKTIHLKGFVLLKDNAQLILRNSVLIIDDHPGSHYNTLFRDYANILLTNSSKLVMTNSAILPKGISWDVGFTDESQLTSTSSKFPNGTIWFDDNSIFQMDQTHLWAMLFDGNIDGRIMNSTVERMFNENWHRNGFIDPREHTNDTILIEDSEVHLFTLRVNGGNITVDSQVVGEHDYWNPRHNHGITGNVNNFTLINSRVLYGLRYSCYDVNGIIKNIQPYIGFSVSNSTLDVIDSNLEWLEVSRSNLRVNGSHINRLRFSSFDDLEYDLRDQVWATPTNATILNTRIRNLQLVNTHLTCENVRVDLIRVESYRNFIKGRISGGITYGPDAGFEMLNFEKMALIHDYIVQTIGDTHVIPKVSLSLRDSNGNVTWTCVSDKEGRAAFNITYCNYYPLYEPYKYITNYNDTWTLTATLGDQVQEQKIRYLETGSPIVFQFSEPGLLSTIEFTPVSQAGLGLILLILVLKLFKKT